MTRALAHIEEINSIMPIEGKDRIVLATVLGWTVIVQKDFNVGDKVVFAEIDSVFPEKPEFEFLRSKKFRIKTMKMAGVISQGIVFPLSILPEGEYNIGDDVTDILGITQYEPTMDKEETDIESAKTSVKKYPEFLMRMAWFRKLVLPKKQAKGFPSFISKTDEVRCLNGNTKIETNFGKIRIADIVNKKMNVLVKTYNENNKSVEFKKILDYQKFEHNEPWVNIKYKINKYGNRENTIKCTLDHMFYTNNGYIKAQDLKVGDKIFTIKETWNDIDIKNILGMVIGDSHIAIDRRKNLDGTSRTELRLQLTQGFKQYDYLKEKIRLLDGNPNSSTKAKSGYCENPIYQYSCKMDYKLSNLLYDLGCIQNGKFVITKNFCDILTPQALAFWYLDDGTLRHRDETDSKPTIQISTNSETREENELLINMLKTRFNIDCNYRKDKIYGSIYLTVAGTKKFLSIITKYIPYYMRYKTIPEFENQRYVLEDVIYEKSDNILETEITEFSINPLSVFSNNSFSYDIEVEDNHNFFANGILTHNCQNAPFYLNMDCKWIATEKVDGQSGSFTLQRIKGKHFWNKDIYDFAVCSRNLRKWKKDDSSYWIVAEKYNIEEILHRLIGDNEWVAIQGECVASNVQGNKYHVTEPDLYVFNLIYPSGRVGSVEAKRIVNELGLKFVPILSEDAQIKGMTVPEVLEYATGKSQLYDTLREGIVFRSEDGKQSFKAVSPEFLLKNNE